jgi:uncharacterized protein (TIGR04255 family)
VTHPSYPNPTIVEVVCEIHFALPPGTSWSPATPGALWREIAAEYPDLEPIVESGIELRVQPDGALSQVITEKKRWRFARSPKTRLVQLAEDIISVNYLKPYPGWPEAKEELIRVWQHFAKVANPHSLSRIGLRYINAIRRDAIDELPSRWLKETPFLPRQPLYSIPPLSSRVEAIIGRNNRAIVSMGIIKRDAPLGHLVFDIDCIREASMEPAVTTISTTVEDLHEGVWNIFQSAKTAELDHLLNMAP